MTKHRAPAARPKSCLSCATLCAMLAAMTVVSIAAVWPLIAPARQLETRDTIQPPKHLPTADWIKTEPEAAKYFYRQIVSGYTDRQMLNSAHAEFSKRFHNTVVGRQDFKMIEMVVQEIVGYEVLIANYQRKFAAAALKANPAWATEIGRYHPPWEAAASAKLFATPAPDR